MLYYECTLTEYHGSKTDGVFPVPGIEGHLFSPSSRTLLSSLRYDYDEYSTTDKGGGIVLEVSITRVTYTSTFLYVDSWSPRHTENLSNTTRKTKRK